MNDDIVNLIQREVSRALSHRTHPKNGLVTSYDPKTHSIKVMYKPDNIESGWIPIACTAAGQAVSHVHGPTPGDGKKTGDQAVIHFFNGDIESPHCVGFLHSDKDPPPGVQSGESLWKHNQTKVAIYIDKKGKVTHQGNEEGLFHQTAKNGPISITTKEKGKITIDSDRGGTDILSKIKIAVKSISDAVLVHGKQVNLKGDPVHVSDLRALGTVLALGPAEPVTDQNTASTSRSGDAIPGAAGSSSSGTS